MMDGLMKLQCWYSTWYVLVPKGALCYYSTVEYQHHYQVQVPARVLVLYTGIIIT